MAIVDGVPARPATVDEVVQVVSVLSGFTQEDIMGHSRRQPLVWWRWAAMVAVRYELGWSYTALADRFDERHFSTVKSAVKKCESDPELAGCVQRIRAELGHPRRRGHLRVIDGLGGDAA